VKGGGGSILVRERRRVTKSSGVRRKGVGCSGGDIHPFIRAEGEARRR
jgi:hypothetical protein